MLLVAAGIFALLLGAAATLLLRPLILTPAPVVPREQPPPATISVSLTSDPPQAAVYRAGVPVPLGLTPLTVNLPWGRAAVELKIAKEGFVPAQLTVIPDQSRPFLVSLARLPSPPTAGEAAARKPRSHRNAGKIRNAVPIDPFAP
jgi:hypothetical protein